MAMKCPNCGSTAQVRLVTEPIVSRDGTAMTEGYVCGCGAHFAVEYERDRDGYWEPFARFVEWIEKGE